MNNGSISQTIYLDADTYKHLVPGRPACRVRAQHQQIEVLFDPGQPTASHRLDHARRDTASSIVTLYAYTLYETSNFTVAAGVHTIQFIGMNPTSGQRAPPSSTA